MISITFFHPLLSPSCSFIPLSLPLPPLLSSLPLTLSPLPLPFFILPLLSFSLSLPFFPLPSFPLFSPLLHSHFSIYPFLSLFLSSFLSQSSRIKTFLPEKKQLWAESEEPIATKNNREKLEQLEEEQKVLQVCLKNSELEWSNLI